MSEPFVKCENVKKEYKTGDMRIPEIPECETCFYYPACVTLKKCASGYGMNLVLR